MTHTSSSLATGSKTTLMETIMQPLSYAARTARWLMAAGLALAAMQSAPASAQTGEGLTLERRPTHPGRGEAEPFFTKVGRQLNCDYVQYTLRFGAQGDPAKFLDPAFIAEMPNVRMDFRDTLPAGLEIVDAQVTGDGTGPGGGALPAPIVSTTTNPSDTVKLEDFRLSTSDLDGSGEPDRRYIDIVITAKIDHAAFPAPAQVSNQGFVNITLVGGSSVEIPSHDPALPDDLDFKTGEPTKITIDVSRCDRAPPPPPPGEACFKTETGTVDCVPGGGAFIYHMPVGSELGGKWVQLRTTTPGVTVAPAMQLAPIGGGVLNWTITGALPGDTVHLIVTGIETYAGPEEGVGLCCSQVIDIEIPEDLRCPPDNKEPDIQVEKRADVARCTLEGGCDFTIRVTNVGDAPYNGPIVLEEVTAPGSAAVVSGPNAPWACVPMASPMMCSHPATTLDPGEWVELKLGFAPGPGWNGRNIRNCAEYDYTASDQPEVFGSTGNDRACATIQICRRGDPRCEPPVEKRTDLRITKDPRSRVCSADGVCTFNIRVFNNGTEPYVGPLTVIDEYPTGVPASSTFGPTPPWTCAPISGGRFQCDHPGVNLAPGAFIPIGVRAVVGPDYQGDLIRNCAEVNGIEGEANLENNRACAEMRIPGREPKRPDIRVEKTGDKECRAGQPCTFEITITNAGTADFNGPMRIGDAIGVDGIGRLEGVVISEISPPFGCEPEPTTLPMSCIANITLGAGEQRVHQVTVVIPEGPLANIREPVPARNCVGVIPPDVPVAEDPDGVLEGPETTGRPGTGPSACHTFTIGRPVAEQCSKGFVMNADGRCVCPEGTRFRNGQCRTVGGEPPPPPPPPVDRCILKPGQIRTQAGECVCPRGTSLIRGECRKNLPQQCELLPGQIRTQAGDCVCPRGTSLVRGACRKNPPPQCELLPGQIRTKDGKCVCPRGTSLVRGQCRKDPPPQCKLLPGQIRTEDGRCVCPRGTRLVDGECRRRQVECPRGTELRNGRCVVIEVECPRGTVMRNGRCVKIRQETCPPGFIGSPPNCRRLQINRDLQLIDPQRQQQQKLQIQ
ncbi:hypothetical protein ABMA32_01765 [Mesorhizobium sp. VNQ89]|uniref:DUF7929 domain-containing protein n=1 Tax=Mesorhizobium quangtriensis TaxID=3157709 RepID=UPI0032B7F8E8